MTVELPPGYTLDGATGGLPQGYTLDTQPQKIGFGGRFMQGVEDPVNGLAQLMLHAGVGISDTLAGGAQTLDTKLAADEANYQARRSASGNDGVDWARMGGSALATAPVAALMPAAEGGLAAKAGIGAAQGVGFGEMQPVTNGGEDYWSDKGTQGMIGAGTGAFVPMAASAVAPQISAGAKALMSEGITPTIGQILGGGFKATEEKLSSVPYLGDIIKTGQKRALDQFNSAALGRALKPIGESTDNIGRKGLEDVSDKLGQAYEQVLPNLKLKLDDTFATDIEAAAQKLPQSEQDVFHGIMSKQFEKFGAGDELTGDTLKGFQSELTRQAKGYGGDASYDKQQLGESLNDVSAAVRQALQRNNPKFAQQLEDINKGYANYAILRSAGGALKEDAPFTPAKLATAIRQNDKSVGKGNFARGKALMQDLSDPANELLGNHYPDSGTFGRALAALGGNAVLHGAVSPITAVASTVAAIPYMNGTTQKLAAALIAKRPINAPAIRDALLRGSAFLNAGIVPGTAGGE